MVWIIVCAIIILFITILCWSMVRINNDKEVYDKISFKESLDLTDLPIVTFINNGKKLNFILDSGASRSILNEKDLSGCSFTRLQDANKLTGLDGTERTVNNVIMSIDYKDNCYEDVFQITDITALCDDIKQATGVNLHGILGTAFFQKYKYVLDFNELVAYSKANK